MQISGLKDITIGVGRLRQQVDFYATNLGLRICARGRIPAELCRRLWQVDDDLNMVILGRQDLPDSPQLRLIPAFDLPARPDFDITHTGPLGILYGTVDIRRTYYRLSSAGVEFHAPPVTVQPPGLRGRRHARKLAFGRAFDGEYVVLAQPVHGLLRDGTSSPYFGVTEPLEISIVVPELALSSRFLQQALGFESVLCAQRGGKAREQAMGLAPGSSFNLETLKDGSGRTRLSLLCFGSGHAGVEARPPSRGICALRFECDDLERSSEACVEAGGHLITHPAVIDHPVLGEGRAATLMAPFGVLIELWQQVRGRSPEG